MEARRAFHVAFGAWIFAAAIYFVPGATWNPVSRFATTRSIVEHATFAIDGLEESTHDRAFRDGHWYSDKAPIPSLLAVPACAIWRAFGADPHFQPKGPRIEVDTSFRNGLWLCSIGTAGLASALLAVLLFEALRARTTPVGALVSASATMLATPLFPYATSFYGHGMAALFFFVAAVIAGKPDASRRHVRWAGACLALAIGCEYLVAFPALVVVLWMLRGREGKAALLIDLALGAVLPLVAIAGYHTVCFGAPWRTGYSFLVHPTFVTGHAGGFLGIHSPKLVAIAGLLFGPRRGLFLVAPVALAGIAGLILGAREGDRTSRLALAVFVTMLLVISGYYMWWGGAAAGPRHLVPMLPLLGFGLAKLWPRVRIPIAALAIVSLAFVIALTAVGLEAPEHGNVITEWVWPNLVRGRLARIPGSSNVGLLVGLHGIASLVPLALWLAAGFAWLTRRARRDHSAALSTEFEVGESDV